MMGVSIVCPHCHSRMTMTALTFEGCDYTREQTPYNFLANEWRGGVSYNIIQVLYKCGNKNCNSLIIGQYQDEENSEHGIYFPSEPTIFDFSQYPYINEISPSFSSLYNQSYKAEQLGCKDIAGAGYRKSAEFLIKDYIINTNKGDPEEVKELFISNCIKKFINDDRIKQLCEGTFRLGNNETHYYNEWAETSLQELKDIIILLCHYIENDLHSIKLLDDISQKRNIN